MIPESEDTVSMSSWQVVLDQVDVAFDDERLVAGAGLLCPPRPRSGRGSSRAPTSWSISATSRGGPPRAQAAHPGPRHGRRRGLR
jgi:hypothetical protein